MLLRSVLAVAAVLAAPAVSWGQGAVVSVSPPVYTPGTIPGLSQTPYGGLRVQLNLGGPDLSLGQSSMAASVPVAIASNQSAIPVSGSFSAVPSITTYQGTIGLSAATSTTLTSGNVSMASGTVLPATFQKLTLINVGANLGFVCWFGGTASASAGCEPIAAGASDTVYLNDFATPPTLFSTAGTTFSFRN